MSSCYPQQFEECPVCYAKLKVETGFLDEGTLCENFETCPNKCYSYEYAYGYTTVYVNVRGHHLMFGWGYSDERQVMQSESSAIDTACEAARRAQLEDYWNLVHGRTGQDHTVLG